MAVSRYPINNGLTQAEVEAIVQDYVDNNPNFQNTVLDSITVNGTTLEFNISDGTVIPQDLLAALGAEFIALENQIDLLELGIPSTTMVLRTPQDFQNLQSGIRYYAEGTIDFTGTGIQIVVPSTGLTIDGGGFEITRLISTEANYDLIIGGGDLFLGSMAISISGANSRVFNSTDPTTNSAVEFEKVNFENCTDIGDLTDYRQTFGTNIGMFGVAKGFTYNNQWAGGSRFTDFILRGSGTSGPIFSAGTNFSFGSRFSLNCNSDQPLDTIAFCDFSPSNFTNDLDLQLDGCLFKQSGNFRETSVYFPNITQSDTKSFWRDNIGIKNTRRGVVTETTVTTTAQNSTAGTGVFVDLVIPWQLGLEQHFSRLVNGRLQYLADPDIELDVIVDFIIGQQGGFGDDFELRLVKYPIGNATTGTPIKTIQGTVSRTIGTTNSGVATFNALVDMKKNEALGFQIASLEPAPSNMRVLPNSSVRVIAF